MFLQKRVSLDGIQRPLFELQFYHLEIAPSPPYRSLTSCILPIPSADSHNGRYVVLSYTVKFSNQDYYGKRSIQIISGEVRLVQKHSVVLFVDSQSFQGKLWGVQQGKSSCLQGLPCGAFQAANRQPQITGAKQVSGIRQEGKVKAQIRQSTAEELSGECYQ